MKQQKHLSTKAFFFSFTLSLAVLGILSAGILFLTNFFESENALPQLAAETPEYQPTEEDGLTILAMGSKDDITPPDRYMLIRFEPEEGVIRLIPVPKELEATVNIKTGTLPQLYDYGGVQMVCDAVRNVFSVKVDRYMKYNDQEFADLVDLFGGVECEVEQTVEYTSESGETVRLVKGVQLLSGKKLTEYFKSPLFTEQTRDECFERRAEIACSAIEQKLVDSIAPRADSLFEAICNLMQTNLNNYDYSIRKEAIGYIAGSSGEKAEYALIDGDYKEDERDECTFTPSPKGKQTVQAWLEPLED